MSNLLALLSLDESAYLSGLNSSQKATEKFTDNLTLIGGAVVVGALAAIGSAVVTVGTAAFDAAETVDEAFDTIEIATGAQGEELAQLHDDWKVVYSSVPTDAKLAADAIGILNTRLGLSGEALQDLTIPLLEAARLLNGDVMQYAENFTRVIGDWNIPVENAAGSLDKLFVAGQKTGIPLETLMERIVKYGAPMRNFGFSFEEATALLSSFEAQGVNTEIVMSGLRIAQGKFIKENKDMSSGLWETIEAIQSAETGTEALSIATGVFGAKAAGDLTDVIRAGKFDLDALVESMMDADGAILNAADSTSDWGEKWKVFQNQMTLALAPIGEKLREGMGDALDELVEIFNRPDVQASIAAFADFAVTTIGGIVEGIPAFIAGVQEFFTFLQNNQGIVIGIFAALGVAAVAWGVATAAAAWGAIAPLLPVIAVLLLVAAAVYLLYQAWTNNMGGIQEKTAAAAAWLKTAWQGVVDFFTAIWNNPVVQAVVQTVLSNIQALFAAFKAAFSGDWYAFGENIRTIWDNNWKLFGTILSAAWEGIKTAVRNGITNIKTFFTETNWGEVGMNIIRGIVNGITAANGWLRDAAASAAQAALDAAKGFLGIRSPSQLFEDQVGANMALGLVRGWERTLLGNPLTPALATASVDLQPRAMPAVSAATAQGGQAHSRAEEEMLRLLRDLPAELARQVASAVAKSQRAVR
jgi:TP901 family phage tail tape measure protein